MRSVRIPTLSPSLTSPIAMPATGAFSGTPASMRAMEAPHTVAMDDDPLDSRMSETIRMVYGKASLVGSTASTARWARAPWPISRRPGVPNRLTSPVEKEGKLEWSMKWGYESASKDYVVLCAFIVFRVVGTGL